MRKTALFTLFILTPILLAAGTVYAARVINPDDATYQESDTSIKFKANPMAVKINQMNTKMQQMEARINYLEDTLKATNGRITELVTTVTAQGTTIINMRQTMMQNNSNINEMMNCGSSGRIFSGSQCVAAGQRQ